VQKDCGGGVNERDDPNAEGEGMSFQRRTFTQAQLERARVSQAKQYLLDNCIKQAGPLETECWVWTGSVISWGYGQASFDGRQQYAHRLSYKTFVGPIPDLMWVLHHCDNPSCINPDHLYCGWPADNLPVFGLIRVMAHGVRG
jgi:hypothetical protein